MSVCQPIFHDAANSILLILIQPLVVSKVGDDRS